MAKARTLAGLGEFELIDRIAALTRGARSATRGVVLGIGDDAALLRPAAGEDVAVSTDACIEGVHFSWQRDDPGAVGRRALAASLSDLAAMGARPLGCTLALAAPPTLRLERLDPLLRGLVREAARSGCPLVGGNVSSAPGLALTTTVIGALRRGRALRRDAARAGDALFVTGELGGAALARREAERRRGRVRRVPAARVEAGRALAALGVRTACIDLSDGLAADLPHLLAPRALGAELDPAVFPRARGFDRRCALAGLDPHEAMANCGEDYELLFALGGRWASAERLAERLGTRVTQIGWIVREPGIRGIAGGGWRHFAGGLPAGRSPGAPRPRPRPSPRRAARKAPRKQ